MQLLEELSIIVVRTGHYNLLDNYESVGIGDKYGMVAPESVEVLKLLKNCTL